MEQKKSFKSSLLYTKKSIDSTKNQKHSKENICLNKTAPIDSENECH
jgi:hypothetical protein